jgi:hypothetical protein
MVKQQKIVLLAAGIAGVLVAAILLVGAVAEVAAQDGRGRPGFARGGGPVGWGCSALAAPASTAPTSPRRRRIR